MSDNSNLTPALDDVGYAIYRTAKIKTEANLSGSSNHMVRAVATPNADPDRAHLNRIIIGGDDPEADVLALLPKVGARDPDTDKMLRRKNSVIAIEVLITASPSWWQNATDQEKADWEKRTIEWIIAEYGIENVAHLRMHGDEHTPHMTGYVVPIDPDSGGLNCRRWIGERQLLRDQQTSYAAAVEGLGLRRGVEGSTATHEAVKRAYGDLSSHEAHIAVPAPSHLTMSPDDWARDATEQMLAGLSPTIARAKTSNTARASSKAANAQAAKDRGRADRAEKSLSQSKQLAAQMRAIPILDVLEALGLEQDIGDPNQFKAEGFRISAGTGSKEGKWYDHIAGAGRGGAIDLVSHVMGCEFKASVAWLADVFGPGAATADLTARFKQRAISEVRKAVEECEPFTPPPAVSANWDRVRTHLVNDRMLDHRYIDKLHTKGDLYADERKNAVFVCRDEHGTVVGAELKGTATKPNGDRFSGMALGSKKDRGGFRIGSMAKAAVIYLVESAIDAISLSKLRAKAGDKNFCVISTAGTTAEPRTWFADLADNVRRFCAFDNDDVGDAAAKKLRRNKFERLRPQLHDWNDDLRASLQSDESGEGTKNPFTQVSPEEDDPSPSSP